MFCLDRLVNIKMRVNQNILESISKRHLYALTVCAVAAYLQILNPAENQFCYD